MGIMNNILNSCLLSIVFNTIILLNSILRRDILTVLSLPNFLYQKKDKES